MGFQEQHDQHIAQLMRTRFPINGDNYKKTPRQYIPRWGKPDGQHDAPFGHARPSHNSPSGLQSFSAYAQLYVYDVKEPDRPVTVNVHTVEAAEDMIRVLSEFIAHKKSEGTN